MKKLSIIFLTFAALVLSSCAGNFKDIRVTSCNLKSIRPSGFSAVEAELEIGIDNPAPEIHLTDIAGLAKYKGEPCLELSAGDVVLKKRSEQTYTIVLNGALSKGFHLVQLLSLLGEDDGLAYITADISCHAALASGIGKDIGYNDVPVKDLIEKF